MLKPSEVLSRIERAVAPQWGIKRARARIAMDTLQRSYEGATTGRRSQGWKKAMTDANAETFGSIASLRAVARQLVRDNPYASSAVNTITDHVVGWGISPAEEPQVWKDWGETTECDADGRNDFYGIEKLVMRTAFESGECLIRRRIRTRPDERFPLPLKLQILEPDFLDTQKDTASGAGPGNQIIQGVEYNGIGQRVGYWLFKDHPGARNSTFQASQFVPAESVIHVYRQDRPGQVRGVSEFASSMLRFKDFDDFEDATLMKQKIAACLAVLMSDVNGAPLGIGDPTSDIDSLEPGIVKTLAPGQTVTVVDPPQATDYPEYSKTQLRAIATGLGVTYEDLTGNYDGLPFSAARMSRIRHWARVESWRWGVLVPQFLNPVWAWAYQAAQVAGVPMPPSTDWFAPPMPMLDPDKEGLAFMRNVRSGLQTLSGAYREMGISPGKHLAQLADDFKELDRLGLVLDSDPRKMTQAGQMQSPGGSGTSTPPTEPQPKP